MSVALDAAVESVRTGTTDPHTWTHTPTGTPRAIVVTVVHGTSSTDHVVGITYGGVAMTRINTAADTVTEPGRADLWFLGSGIPAGNQTVSVDLASATTDDIHFVSMSFTAAADCEVVDSDLLQGDQANPSVTLQYGGRTCIAVAALYGGGAAPTSFTPNANCTTVHDHDLGAFYSEVIRQTTPGSADFAIGGTSSSDDVAYVALALSEVISSQEITGAGAIAGGEGFGTAALDLTFNPGGVASAEALGTPTVELQSALEITSAGAIGTGEALGITALDLSLDPAGLGTLEGFGVPVLELTIDPAGISSGEAFGSVIVELGGSQWLPCDLSLLGVGR